MTTLREQTTARRFAAFLIIALKVALFFVVIYFVSRAFASRMSRLQRHELNFDILPLAMATLCTVGARMITAATYGLLVQPFQKRPGWRSLLAIAWMPTLAKYVPGKVTSFLGALWVFRKSGIRASVASAVIFITRFLTIGTAAALSAPALLQLMGVRDTAFVWLASTLGFAGACVLLHPRLFKRLANALLSRLGRDPLEKVPPPSSYFKALAATLIQWLFSGASLWFVALCVTSLEAGSFPIFLSAAALATTIGLMAFFSPAGLGAREGMFLLTLSHTMPESRLAIAILVHRAIQVAADVLLAVTGSVLLYAESRSERKAAGPV